MASHRLPHHPRGWIYEYKCTDPGCFNCEVSHQMRVYFGLCYRMEGCPDESIMYDCTGTEFPSWQSMFVQARWENQDCAGTPRQEVGHRSCYTRPFGLTFEEGQCGNGDRYKPRAFYKYMCYLDSGHRVHAEEDAIGDAVGMKSMDTHIDNGIVAIILLFVCFTGVIVGYLIRRRAKRKTAENNSLLCEANSTDNF